MNKIILSVSLLVFLFPCIAFSDVTGKTLQKYPDGNPKEVGYYSENRKIAAEIFDEKGNKWKAGKIPDGTVRKYYENGVLEAEEKYKDDKLNGPAKYFDKNGRLMTECVYKDDKEEGLHKSFEENGRLRGEYNYSEGKLEGLTRLYDQNSRLRGEYSYSADKLKGQSKMYYEDGKIREEFNYKDGEKLASAIVYCTNGKIKEERLFTDSVTAGTVKAYYDTGKIKEEWEFKDGKKEGQNIIYYDNGKIQYRDIYKKGVKINSKKYDRAGKWILNQDYPEAEAGADKVTAPCIPDSLFDYFQKINRFNILDRTVMKILLKEEAGPGLKECRETKCIAEAGRILNVKFVVSGRISKVAEEFYIDIRVVNTGSSEIEAAEIEKCGFERDIAETVQKMAKNAADKVLKQNPSEIVITIAVLDY